MKGSFFGGLVLITFAPVSVQAQTKAMSLVNSNPRGSNSFQATPFQLVFLADRGHFRNRGIPSYGAFLSADQSGRISAKDIVSIGIAVNRVPAEIIRDKGYLEAVKSYLDSLVSEHS